LLDWRPRFVGALGGAAIYAAVAVGAWNRVRAAAWVAAMMPIVPLLAIAAWSTGISEVAPEAAMVSILVVQSLASLSGISILRSSIR